MTSRALAITGLAAALALALAGCGSSSGGGVTIPVIPPARTYHLSGFQPAGPVRPGAPTTVSFTITQPSGQPLTAYRTCCDPHAGVDLIIVRSDDSHVQYDDSDIGPGGRVSQPVTFPTPGRYRVVIDAYPAHPPQNGSISFQLFTWITVAGPYHPQPVPPYRASEVVDGYHFQIEGHPHIQSIQALSLTIRVTDPAGHPVHFGTWRGALAHSIFIRSGSLDYFHTHVCPPGGRYCTSTLGATRVTGSSSAPGVLNVGVLLPVPGVWRMFLLTYIGGKHQVAPFTLDATS
jgi:hypothetical protein